MSSSGEFTATAGSVSDEQPGVGGTEREGIKRSHSGARRIILTERLVARFWEGVDKRGPDECWPWRKAQASDGWYGRLTVRERGKGLCVQYRPNRVSWTIANGPIGPGLNVCHHCDNPPCCNPAHLFLAVQRDNVRDAATKGRMKGGYRDRTHCKRGHAFTPENTYQNPNYRRHRRCRQCANQRARELRVIRSQK